MSEIKLLPCPFCGGEAHKRTEYPVDADGLEMNLHVVGCRICEVEFSWLWDEGIAIKRWNTRKPMQDIVERLEDNRFWMPATYDADGFCNDDSEEVVYLDKAIQIVKGSGWN